MLRSWSPYVDSQRRVGESGMSISAPRWRRSERHGALFELEAQRLTGVPADAFGQF